MVRTASPHSVAATVERLVAELNRRGVRLFAVIDHAEEAQAAGLELLPEVLLIFGDPRVGTLLMQEDPAVGIDLPMKLLVWQENDTTLVGYRDPAELAERYLLAGHPDVLDRMREMLAGLVSVAVR